MTVMKITKTAGEMPLYLMPTSSQTLPQCQRLFESHCLSQIWVAKTQKRHNVPVKKFEKLIIMLKT